MSQLHGLVKFVQEAVENGATSVEEIHRSIANQPFEILKNFISGESPVDDIQKFQNDTIGNVYETIRTVNKQASEIAKDLLAKAGVEDSTSV